MTLKERFAPYDDDVLFDRVRLYTDAEVHLELDELKRRLFTSHIEVFANRNGVSLHTFIDLLKARAEEGE